MAEGNRGLGELNGVHRRPKRRVGQVDHHTEFVHPFYNFDTEQTQPTIVSLKVAVPDIVLAPVGQPRQPDAGVVEYVHPLQFVADGQVFHGRQETHLTHLLCGLDLRGVADIDYTVMTADI